MSSWAKSRAVDCQECNRKFITVYPRKLFCEPCGIKRRNNRKTEATELARLAKNPALSAIAERSDGLSLADAITYQPRLRWSVAFITDYSQNASKNRRWSNNGSGVTFLTREVRKYENDLIVQTRYAVRGQAIKHAKLWISIFVQKPNHRSDAINVVDTICDAIKKAVDLDDRWFCIGRVDWEVVKKDPKIYIRIGQEATTDMLVCSHCGVIQEVEKFPPKANGPFGHDRVCKECRSELSSHKTLLRRERRAKA